MASRGTIFGYRHVSGVPLCPCRDPGNYMMLEQPGDDPLVLRFRCWCGSTMKVTFDSLAERTAFVAGHSQEGESGAQKIDDEVTIGPDS